MNYSCAYYVPPLVQIFTNISLIISRSIDYLIPERQSYMKNLILLLNVYARENAYVRDVCRINKF